MEQVIVITGASSGFGALTARALANAGHIVYAGMRETTGRNAVKVKELEAFAETSGVKISALEMDVLSQTSVDNAIAQVEKERGQIDVIIHNAGHMVSGAAEAFTPEQLAQLYDVMSYRLSVSTVLLFRECVNAKLGSYYGYPAQA